MISTVKKPLAEIVSEVICTDISWILAVYAMNIWCFDLNLRTNSDNLVHTVFIVKYYNTRVFLCQVPFVIILHLNLLICFLMFIHSGCIFSRPARQGYVKIFIAPRSCVRIPQNLRKCTISRPVCLLIAVKPVMCLDKFTLKFSFFRKKLRIHLDDKSFI